MNTTCCWTVFLSLFNWSINPAFAQYSNLNTGDMTVIAGAQWEFYQGDCSGQDISAHAVSGLGSTYEDRLLACATLCLDRSNCVAFNYPVPGNGTSLWHHQNCWMKHNPNRQESQYLGETCGLKNQDTYEYYTLIYATVPTDNPSKSPSEYPTANPTHDPTFNPTFYPSTDPTVATSDNPTTNPTVVPSTDPTVSPSNDPSGAPSFSPSKAPTNKPTAAPSQAPSNYPTRTPSDAPTSIPTSSPTTAQPTLPPQEPNTFDELTVTTSFNTGIGGFMFDIQALDDDITISQLMFSFNGGSGSTQRYNLYYKQGSLVGFNENSAAWTLACSGSTTPLWTGVYSNTGNADYNGITDASQCAFIIPAGEKYAVYIHGISRDLVVQKEGSCSFANVVADNDYFVVHTGYGVSSSNGPFGDAYGNNFCVTPSVRIFYGFHIPTTAVPTSNPTKHPTSLLPTASPSALPSYAPTTESPLTAAPSKNPSLTTTSYPTVRSTQIPSLSPIVLSTAILTANPSLEPTMEPTNIDEETTYVVTSTTVLVTDTFTTFDEDYCDANMVQRKKFRARMKRKLSNNIFDPEGCQFCLCQEIGQSVCNNLFDFASWDQTVYEQVFNELCPMNEFADLMNENGEQCDWMQIRVKDESDITECGCSAFYCQDEAFNGSGANGLRLNNVLMVVVLVTFGVWM